MLTAALVSVCLVAWGGPPELVYSPTPVEIVAAPLAYDTIPSAEEVVFLAPLHTDEIAPGLWSVQGVAAPTSQHWGGDPLGAGGYTTQAWTATGAPTALDSPFGNTAGTRIGARYYNGTNEYYTSDTASIWSPESGDFSACVLFKTTTTGWIAGDREGGGGGEGWGLWQIGAATWFMVENHAATVIEVPFNTYTTNSGAWMLCCGTHDYDGVVTIYCNGVADPTTQASPGGVIAPTVAASIAATTDGVNDFTDAVAWVGYWQGTVLSAANVLAIHNALQGMSASAGPDITFTRATTAWGEDADGQYQAFGPGMAVQTEDGPSVWGAVTNYATNSLDMSAWANIGTPTITTDTDSGPFSVYNGGAEADTMEDNDGAGTEGKASATAGTTDSTYTVSCWLKQGTITDYSLSVLCSLGTGGGTCTGTDLGAEFVRKTCSGTCVGATGGIYGRIQVGDANADTGTIIVTGCQFEKATYAGRPCLAAGAAATCNAESAAVDATALGILDGAGTLASDITVSLDFTPDLAAGAVDSGLWRLADTAVGTDYWFGRLISSTNRLYLYMYSAAEGALRVVAYETTGAAMTAGTTYNLKWFVPRDGNGARAKIWRNGVSSPLTTGGPWSPPDSLDTLYVGGYGSGSPYANGSVSNHQVSR